MYLKDPEFRSSSLSFTKRYYITGSGIGSLDYTSGEDLKPLPRLAPAEGELNTPIWQIDPDEALIFFLQEATVSISATVVYQPAITETVASYTKLFLNDSQDNILAAATQANMSLNEAVNYSLTVSSTFHVLNGDGVSIGMLFKSVDDAVNCSVIPRTDDNLPVSMIVISYIHV